MSESFAATMKTQAVGSSEMGLGGGEPRYHWLGRSERELKHAKRNRKRSNGK